MRAPESTWRHDRLPPPRRRVARGCCQPVARAQSAPRAVQGAGAVRAQRYEGEPRDPDEPERARDPPPAAAGRAIVPLDWVKAFDQSAGPTASSGQALSSSSYGKYYHRDRAPTLASLEHFVIR